MTAEPNILILGNVQAAEMQAVVSAVHRLAPQQAIRLAGDVRSLEAEHREADWFPDLVTVCQNWPDEFSPRDVTTILNLFPLARLICCYGLWCESDGRNRDIWPAAVRIPARQAAQRIEHELAVLKGEQPPLPLTATRNEIYEFDYDHPLPGGTGRTVSVTSPDREYRRSLEELLTAAGYEIVPDKDRAPYVVLWDLDPWREDLGEEIKTYCSRHENTAIIGLMSFATPEVIRAVRACGVVSVIPKLTDAGRISAVIEECLAPKVR